MTHLLRKGNFLDPGDIVGPGSPRALPPWPEGEPRNRLGLAHWLLDARNPLTARVAVNRYWAQIFGVGLVETEEDFGTQGASEPSRAFGRAGCLVSRVRLEHQSTFALDRHFGDLSPIVKGSA